MDMSSLSMEDLGRLSDLLDELSAVVNDKEDIIKNIALFDVKKMNHAIDTKNKSNEKASKFTIEDLSMSRNIDEIKSFVTSNLDSSYEMHEIDENAKRLNEELDSISEREEYLKSEIEKLVKFSSIDNSQSNGILLETLNTTILILDQEIPKTIDKISPDSCRIINCGKELIKEIYDLLSQNITEKEVYTDESIYENFNKLKDRVNEYEREKNKSDDKQLEMLKRPILPELPTEEVKVEETTEEKVEEPEEEVKVEEEKPINLETKEEEEKPIVLDTTTEEPKVDLEVKEPEVQEEQPVNLEAKEKEAKPIVLDTATEEPKEEEKVIQVDSLESLENLQKEMKTTPVTPNPEVTASVEPIFPDVQAQPQVVEAPKQPDNIVPLSSFLETPVATAPVTPSPEVTPAQEIVPDVQAPQAVQQPSIRTITIEKGVDPDLVRAARTKKAKLAKIHGNTQGSYAPVKIVKFEDLGKVDTSSEAFNLDNFINQQPTKAAA